MHIALRPRVLVGCCLVVVAAAQTAGKRPLHHRDYDSWKTIQNQVSPATASSSPTRCFLRKGTANW